MTHFLGHTAVSIANAQRITCQPPHPPAGSGQPPPVTTTTSIVWWRIMNLALCKAPAPPCDTMPMPLRLTPGKHPSPHPQHAHTHACRSVMTVNATGQQTPPSTPRTRARTHPTHFSPPHLFCFACLTPTNPAHRNSILCAVKVLQPVLNMHSTAQRTPHSSYAPEAKPIAPGAPSHSPICAREPVMQRTSVHLRSHQKRGAPPPLSPLNPLHSLSHHHTDTPAGTATSIAGTPPNLTPT